MIFPIYLALAFKIVKIKNCSRKIAADRFFLFSIQICLINTAVPSSVWSLVHISAEKNRIIHNTITLYTIIRFYNGLTSRSCPFYKLHQRSGSLKVIGISICRSRIFLYIADLTIFIYPVYTIFYCNIGTFFGCYRLSQCINKITCISIDLYLITSCRKLCFCSGSCRMDLTFLGIINGSI